MAIEETVQMVSVLIAASAVVVGVVSFISSNKSEEKQRKAQIFMNLYGTIQSPEFLRSITTMMYDWQFKDYDDYFKKYGGINNPKSFAVASRVLAFYEGMGVLLKNNLIDLKLVNDLQGTTALAFWEKYEPVIKGQMEYQRTHFKVQKPIWLGLEYLVNELKIQATKFPEQQ
jgi:hypothetical protein